MTDSHIFGRRGNGLREGVSKQELKNLKDRNTLDADTFFFGTTSIEKIAEENNNLENRNGNGNGNKAISNTNEIEGSREEFDANFGEEVNINQNKFFERNGYFKGSAEDIAARAKKERLNQQNLQRLGRYAQKRRGGVLRYPLEALTEQTDYLQIDIEKYEPIGSSYASAPGSSNRYVKGNIFSNRAGRRGVNKLSTKPLINAGTILLPIPANLSDTNNVQYDSSTLNGLAAAGVQAAEGVMTTDFTQGFNQGLSQLSQVRKDVASNIKGGVTEASATNVITKALAAEAVNIFGANVTVNQLLARGNGEILNPNMELLFGGPTLRNFRFQFKFTPRNQRESEQVKLIIRAFKRNMAPQAQGGDLGSGNWFLKTPNVFKLRYRSGRIDHPFLNRFKQCFLSDMQTTYTGDGVYMTYDDATPVSIILDLSFKEIQPIYDIDYDERPGDSAVGY